MLETSVKRQILVRAKSAFLLQEKEQKNKIAFLAEDNQASFVPGLVKINVDFSLNSF